MPIRPALAALLASLVVAVPNASAGGLFKWTQLGDANLGNIDEATLARTPDGTLHVVWTIPAPNNDSLVHDAVAANGTAAAPNVITGGWATINETPALVTTSSGLQVFFGGIRTTDPNEPNQNMNTATAPFDGGAWNLQMGSIVTGDAAYGSDTGASLLPDGTPMLAFGGTGSGTFVHRGLDPSTQNFNVQTQLGSCCGYSPNIGVDRRDGSPFVVWVSNATNNQGVFAQSLDPNTGAPSGPPAHMPNSFVMQNGAEQMNQQLQRVGVAARVGGGVYVIYPGDYPTTKRVFLWRIADSQSSVVATSNFDHIANIAADPNGRLWAVWAQNSSPPQIFARRSNLTATKFGPAVREFLPKGEQSVFKIAGNAQSSLLDVVALLGDSSGKQAQWHIQLPAGMSLSASPSAISGSKSTAVKFTVTDPDPVKGAKVTVGGKSATTDSKGHATISLGPTGAKSITATAKKADYEPATKKIKVK